jgi:5'-nucleotidase / UDP-sugar diphosphatase
MIKKKLLQLIKIQLIYFIYTSLAFAAELQILHTNDLHGHLEHTVYDKDKGGYENIKLYMDYLKYRSNQKGVKTLQLDAGDFSEGSFFYFSQNGLRTFEVMDKMGYDVVLLGNHDWLMGEEILSDILEETRPKYSLLAANFISDGSYDGIDQYVRPFRIFKVDGLKIAVMGITTDELFYSWRVKNTKIKEPIKAALRLSKYLKEKREVDYVIALTHLGLDQDKILAKKSIHIDAIVGGHSHTPLFKPVLIKNKEKKSVPIVQAGSHGEYLGKLELIIEKDEPLKIKKYKLLKVINTPLPDLKVKKYVHDTRVDLENTYGKEWLNEVIGETKIDLINSKEKPTFWANFMAEAFKESTNADIAFNVPALAGDNLKKGLITREDMFWLYPRLFEFNNKMGWTLWTNEMYGFVLKLTLEIVTNHGFALGIAGISFDTEEVGNGKVKLKNIKINGEKLKYFKRYKVSMPEGVYRGAFGISKLLGIVFMDTQDSGINIIQSLEDKIISKGRVIGNKINRTISSLKTFSKSSKNIKSNRAWIPDLKYRKK